jgi:hypothetical protein
LPLLKRKPDQQNQYSTNSGYAEQQLKKFCAELGLADDGLREETADEALAALDDEWSKNVLSARSKNV